MLLRQGHWLGDNQVRDCEGSVLKVTFDSGTLIALNRQQQRQPQPLTVSWLEAPEGIQLLRASQEDECRWQPKESDL